MYRCTTIKRVVLVPSRMQIELSLIRYGGEAAGAASPRRGKYVFDNLLFLTVEAPQPKELHNIAVKYH